MGKHPVAGQDRTVQHRPEDGPFGHELLSAAARTFMALNEGTCLELPLRWAHVFHLHYDRRLLWAARRRPEKHPRQGRLARGLMRRSRSLARALRSWRGRRQGSAAVVLRLQ